MQRGIITIGNQSFINGRLYLIAYVNQSFTSEGQEWKIERKVEKIKGKHKANTTIYSLPVQHFAALSISVFFRTNDKEISLQSMALAYLRVGNQQ